MHELNSSLPGLELALWLAGVAQLSIAVLNLFLPHILGWKDDLDRMSLLVRQVFCVHAWFISITLAIFGVLTARFAAELAAGTNDVGRWLAAGIGLFWGIRTLLQITYYDTSHWRGRPGRTAIHVTLLAVYGGMAACYLWAALHRTGGPA